MKIFIPHKKDNNIYFDEIMRHAKCSYTFGPAETYDSSYAIVMIHFPEAIFLWKPPSQRQLEELEVQLLQWRENSKIVLTLNDHKSHYDVKNEFGALFQLVQSHADGVIHLGHFSLQKFKNLYRDDCAHVVIKHPLYTSLLSFDTEDYEKKLGVEFKNRYVVAAIGNLRSIEEAKFVLKAFKKLKVKHKILVVPKMFNFIKLPKYLPYRCRHIYRYLIEKWYCFPLKRSQYVFGYNHIDYKLMVDLLNKTALLIIPRLKSLNSGLVYLGLTFDIPMLIPKTGNLAEFSNDFDYPLLDLKKRNYSETYNKLREVRFEDYLKSEEYSKEKAKFHPKKISEAYEQFFKRLIIE